MQLKDLLAQLSEGQNLNQLAIAYAIAKDGKISERQDRYRGTVERILKDPTNSKYVSLKHMFSALDVDIETAIAIAANQKLSERQTINDG